MRWDHDTEPVSRGLAQVRWLLIAVEVAMAGTFLWAADHEHRPFGLLVVAGLLVGFEVLRRFGIGTRPLAHAAIDLGALAALSLLWGPHHPLQPLSLVILTLVAVVLPARQAWSITVLALGLQLIEGALQAQGGEDALHLISHVGIGGIAAVTLTWFSLAIGTALRAREEARRRAVEDTDRAARLAVVGTLAAGVAHELATPLGSIELLAEEAGIAESGADRETVLLDLRGQVRRCRGILDRLLQRGDGALLRCESFGDQVETWTQSWSAANPEVELSSEVSPELRTLTVRGDGDAWRGAVWTLLDNARRAGGPIQVTGRVGVDGAEIVIGDRGDGPSVEAISRAGEPFFSDWNGTGLGLYAVRTLLEGVDGHFHLAPREGGGATAKLTLPEAA